SPGLPGQRTCPNSWSIGSQSDQTAIGCQSFFGDSLLEPTGEEIMRRSTIVISILIAGALAACTSVKPLATPSSSSPTIQRTRTASPPSSPSSSPPRRATAKGLIVICDRFTFLPNVVLDRLYFVDVH